MPATTLIATPDDPEPIRFGLIDTVIPRADGGTFRVGQHVQVNTGGHTRQGRIVVDLASLPLDGNTFRMGPPPSKADPTPRFDSFAVVSFDGGKTAARFSTRHLVDDPGTWDR